MKSKSPKGKKSGKPGRKGGNKRKSKQTFFGLQKLISHGKEQNDFYQNSGASVSSKE